VTGPHDVVVVGSFMMDLVVRAPRRPRAGETLVGTSLEQFHGGKGCNQAIAAARAGARTAMVGRVGADDHGRSFLDLLDRDGIDADCVIVDEHAGTGIGLPLVEDSGENSIVVIPRANAGVGPADVEAAGSTLDAAKVLLLQLELPADASVAAARRVRAAGGQVVLNPAPAVEDLAPFEGLVDLLVPNEGEAAALTGIAGDPVAAGRALQERFGCAVIVTLGERGSLVLSADGSHEPVAAHVAVAIDTVGAGDAYCGSLAARLAAGDDLVTAARYASAAASLSVTRAGAEPSMPTLSEVATLLADAAVPS
jgi:ribokinase